MIILASNSPRRKQILALAGWDFTALPADIDERPLPGEDPRSYVLRLAECKAETVHSSQGASIPGPAVIIAADTTVALDDEILGKPATPEEAEMMLRRLRKRNHQVYTALAILDLSVQTRHSRLVCTDVHMRDYSDLEIADYIASGDPLDKAGAYAIQHSGFHPVDHVDGCWANVVGMPLCQLNPLLFESGCTPAGAIHLTCSGESQASCQISTYFAQSKIGSGNH